MRKSTCGNSSGIPSLVRETPTTTTVQHLSEATPTPAHTGLSNHAPQQSTVPVPSPRRHPALSSKDIDDKVFIRTLELEAEVRTLKFLNKQEKARHREEEERHKEEMVNLEKRIAALEQVIKERKPRS
eukprot:m51a1_g10647 hypothetical protein (128) ;mRNA; f:32981-33476